MLLERDHLIKLKLISVGFATIILSACYATTGLKDVAYNKNPEVSYDRVPLLNDVIIAIGKPSTPVKNHEYALALVGASNNYLIEPNNPYNHRQHNPKLFNDIFSTVDLNYLYLNTSSTPKNIDTSAATNELKAFIVDGNLDDRRECNSVHGCADLALRFQKPVAMLKNNEEKTLTSLGFRCLKLGQEDKTLECSSDISVSFTILQTANKNEAVQHKFKQPLYLSITQVTTSTSKPNSLAKGLLILYPAAAAIDIITFPLQFAYVYNNPSKFFKF